MARAKPKKKYKTAAWTRKAGKNPKGENTPHLGNKGHSS